MSSGQILSWNFERTNFKIVCRLPSLLTAYRLLLTVKVTCSHCSVSLQIDESKATSDNFKIRCPKCQSMIPVQSPKNAAPKSVAAPAARNWETQPAATFQKNSAVGGDDSEMANNADVMRVLAAALRKTSSGKAESDTQPQKRALMCLNPERNRATAERLADAGYKIFLADNPAQATEKIRDGEVDVIIFSWDFAAKFSGTSVLQQVINALPTIERRNLFVVAIEDNSQTFNMHEAFLRNLNLIVNSNDLHHLPSILYRALRDHNELYRHFNKALTKAV